MPNLKSSRQLKLKDQKIVRWLQGNCRDIEEIKQKDDYKRQLGMQVTKFE